MLEEDPFGEVDLVGDVTSLDGEFVVAAGEVVVDYGVGKLPAKVFEDQACFEVGVYAHLVLFDNSYGCLLHSVAASVRIAAESVPAH